MLSHCLYQHLESMFFLYIKLWWRQKMHCSHYCLLPEWRISLTNDWCTDVKYSPVAFGIYNLFCSSDKSVNQSLVAFKLILFPVQQFTIQFYVPVSYDRYGIPKQRVKREGKKDKTGCWMIYWLDYFYRLMYHWWASWTIVTQFLQ